MVTTKPPNEHVLITAPDRYWNDSYAILLVDFEWNLAETLINPLRSSKINLAIHVFDSQDTDYEWLLNVAASCNIVLLNLNQPTKNDVIKGNLISKHNVWYTGQRNLEKIWTGYTEDPLATLLIKIENYQTSRGN
jgi:hypothetical protein